MMLLLTALFSHFVNCLHSEDILCICNVQCLPSNVNSASESEGKDQGPTKPSEIPTRNTQPRIFASNTPLPSNSTHCFHFDFR